MDRPTRAATLLRGQSAEAVIGVGPDESAAMVDGVMTLGLLWLDYCREHSVKKAGPSRHYSGLKVIVPAGAWRTTAERMAWLNGDLAHCQLFTLDPRSEELIEIDVFDYRKSGVAAGACFRCFCCFGAGAGWGGAGDGADTCGGARARVEVRARSAAEVGLLLHGLEFARVRQASKLSFAREEEITFGAGANETVLTEETEALCSELLASLFASRRADGSGTDRCFGCSRSSGWSR